MALKANAHNLASNMLQIEHHISNNTTQITYRLVHVSRLHDRTRMPLDLYTSP